VSKNKRAIPLWRDRPLVFPSLSLVDLSRLPCGLVRSRSQAVAVALQDLPLDRFLHVVNRVIPEFLGLVLTLVNQRGDDVDVDPGVQRLHE